MARRPWFERLYRLLLRLLPREFRGDFGDAMTEDFKDQRDDAERRGPGRVRRLWLRSIGGLFWLASREHAASVIRDATHALRLFRRRPAFTLTTILTLTAGIGVTTAAFSIVQAVVLQQIPGPESDRLVRIFEVNPETHRAGSVSNANFVDWTTQVATLDGLAVFNDATGTVYGAGNSAEHLQGLAVSDDFLRITGLSPRLGRLFVADDFAAWHAAYASSASSTPQPRVMILHERAWQRVFGGRPDVIGMTVQLNENPVEVIGVLADHPLLRTFTTFAGPDTADYWVPGGAWSGVRRRARTQAAIGRLAPGVAIDRAQAELDVVAARLEAAYPEDNAGWTIRVTPLREAVATGVRTQLWFLFGTSLCVVLIASLNVARLIATLNTGRRQEFLTRLALGASRYALSRQALTEGLLLSLVGGAAGVLLAYLLLPALVALAPGDIPRLGEVTLHGQTLVFAAGLMIVVGLTCGLASRAMTPTRLVVAGLAERASFGWWRAPLLAGQVALALMLAVATSLLVRSMQHVEALDLGFVPQNVVAATIALPRSMAFDVVSGHQSTLALIERLHAHPGVVAAATGSRPLGSGGISTVARREDGANDGLRISVGTVSVEYFRVVGASLRSGRFFTEADAGGSSPVVILNARAATELGMDDDAVGRRVVINDTAMNVVGVLADVRQAIEDSTGPAVYIPAAQAQWTRSGQILIRTAGPPDAILADLRAIVAEHDSRVALYRIQTLDERLRQLTAPRRFLLQLVTTFSVLAIGLAMIGLAGVMAESVAQRMREIGVRMALGAQPDAIVSLMVRRGLRVVGVGVLCGLGLAYQLRGTLDGFVFGVPTSDPLSYTLAALSLLAATFAACLIPARRAAAVDPVVALRQE